jgi:uncharacterized protein
LVNPGSFTGDLHLQAAAAAYTHKASASVVASVITLVVTFVFSTLAAAGEEIGWRGFLLPQLTKIWNIKTAVIVAGLIWAVWHLPIIVAGLYLPGTPLWYQIPTFVIEIMAVTVIMAVLRLTSNSLWPTILLHGSHNFFDQAIFGPLTNGANKSYFVGETGLITVLVSILVAAGIVLLFRTQTGQADRSNIKVAVDSSQAGV